MTTNNDKFVPANQQPGDPLRSADWNAAMQEIVRLETAKINREGAESLQGPLTITEALSVSAIAPPTSTPLEIRGALKLAEGVAVNQFSVNESLGENSDSIVPTQKAVKNYVDTAVQGSETQDFQAKDLRIYGNLTVIGDVIAKDTQKMEGNVELGNEDGDIITVFGTLRSGHSSHALQVEAPLQVSENLIVSGGIGIGTTSPTTKLEVVGDIKATGNLIVDGTLQAKTIGGTEALDVSAIAPPTSTPLEIRGALKLAEGVAVNQFSADDSLGDNSDSIIPTQKAVKTYIDTAVKNSVDTGNQSAVVRGMIMMWSGQANQIPNGWALCDGQNGTPDLRDRFIVGAGSKYTVNVTGGEEFHRLTIDEMPSHEHSNGSFGYFLQVTGARTYSGGSDSSPNEPDLFTAGWNKTVGGNQAHENRPPFYALAFIMKL